MKTRLLLLLIASPFLAATSCNDNTPVSARPAPILESLALEADMTTATVGQTIVFTATGTLHAEVDPTTSFDEDMTALVLWDSSDPDILLPGADGRATAKAAGTVSITARTPPGDINGAGISSDPIQVTVSP